MSRFKIYQIDHYDPIKVGRKNRMLFVIYSIVPTLIIILFNIYSNWHYKPVIILTIILPIVILIYIFLIRKLKNETKKIKTIGDIEFTTTGIKKRIGDSLVEYKYTMIKVLEIQKHIPATSAKDTKSGYFSYILKIIFTDFHSESIVISDKSIDSTKKLSIIETLRTLKRMTKFEIKLP